MAGPGRSAVAIAKPALLATTKQNWIDGDKIPATGGCLIVLNHISHVDPLTAAHILWDHGRIPRYLAKSGLFKSKALGAYLKSAGMIPVERLSKNAAGRLRGRGGRGPSRRVRRGLPGGHDHPRPGRPGR